MPHAPMPTHTTANDTVNRVLARAGITQNELAAGCGLDHSYISRVCSAQYAVPPEVVRWLWQRTHDHDLLEAILGETRIEAYDDTDPPKSSLDLGVIFDDALGRADTNRLRNAARRMLAFANKLDDEQRRANRNRACAAAGSREHRDLDENPAAEPVG